MSDSNSQPQEPSSGVAVDGQTIPNLSAVLDGPAKPQRIKTSGAKKDAAPAKEPVPTVAPAAVAEPPAKPVDIYSQVEKVVSDRLPDYKTMTIGEGPSKALAIGLDPRVAVECKVTHDHRGLQAHFYGFIKKTDRERIVKALGDTVVSTTGVFLHRSGR